MSYGEGGKGLAICLIAVVILGSLAIGMLLSWNPFPPGNGGTTSITGDSDHIYYNFTSYESEFNDSVALDFFVNSGSIVVQFVDSPSLLYRIEVSVENETVLEEGPPEVQLCNDLVLLFYQACDVVVTLGSDVMYFFNLNVNSGAVYVTLNEHANIGDSTLAVNSGQVSLDLRNQCTLQENTTFNLLVNSGEADAEIALPEGVGGDFYGMVNSGMTDISGITWGILSEGHYRSPGYASAEKIFTIVAAVNSGFLDVVLF